MTDYSRGDLVWANLEPVRSGEQGKTRPCVIVSYDALNHSQHPCVIVCPITGKENVHKDYPTHVLLLAKAVPGIGKNSVVMAEQIRAIAKARLDPHKKPVPLPGEVMAKIANALQRVLEIYFHS